VYRLDFTPFHHVRQKQGSEHFRNGTDFEYRIAIGSSGWFLKLFRRQLLAAAFSDGSDYYTDSFLDLVYAIDEDRVNGVVRANE